ncbi:hypothetical protein GH714_023913 [Hevea brasiliensis]|uniref:Isopenicillin N synthase-like Fe(2+) 2OG dioxygenase domain-containing protein n=1 Tax=Hevea brasiliensis TaxID=3981 RepID=A0A6A6LMQ6_HEVBR|nr:hypothetical protein GH714_023913 [Hevea brasiliensis]
MAGISVLPAEVLLAKRVQEMVLYGEEPQPPHISHGREEKHAKGVYEFEGYGADPVPAEGQSLDWSDRLFLTYTQKIEGSPSSGQKIQHLSGDSPCSAHIDSWTWKIYLKEPKEREVLEEYTLKMRMLTELVSKAMAKSLNLEENCFLDQFGEQAVLQARFNYYSRCQRPDLVLGLKAHADGSGYTIILQNDVEGLQVQKDKNWITVPPIQMPS